MKFITATLLTLLCCGALAQKKPFAFGKIEKDWLLLKDCSFDKGAAAAIIFDRGYTYYTKNNTDAASFKTIFERRTRLKIFTAKGLEQANVTIPFYSRNNEEVVRYINAKVYNLDAAGNILVTTVSRSSFFTKKVNADFSQLTITFPQVKPGSVIEYSYTLERATLGQLRDWFFQERLPVYYSEYELLIPQQFRFMVQPFVIDSMHEEKDVTTERLYTGNVYANLAFLKNKYSMRNLPGIKDEPFMGSAKDYMQRLEFHLAQIDYGNNNIVDLQADWTDIMEELNTDKNFGRQLYSNIDAATPLIETAKKIVDKEERLKFLYASLKNKMQWNGATSIFTDRNLNIAWQQNTGNGATINLLLTNILSKAGITASPVLYSTRDNGLVNTHYPFLSQFNNVAVYVTINENHFVLDATNKFLHYTLVPPGIVNSQALIVDDNNGRWTNITSDKKSYKIVTVVNAVADSNANVKGDCLITHYNYAAAREDEVQQRTEAAFITNCCNDAAIAIDNFSINNTGDSLPLEHRINFTAPSGGTGNYRYFTISHFFGLQNNPFVADERLADIDFGVNQEYTLYGKYIIPEDYIFDELPENTMLTMPDTSIIFTSSIATDENILTVKMSVLFNQSFYLAYNYSDIAAFYKKMFAVLHQQIVLKKKTHNP
jgi:hypothetical protein